MNIKYLNKLLSISLIGVTSLTPVEDSYVISLPLHIDLMQQGSFDVSLYDHNIDNDDEITIEFDETFLLKDEHNSNDISGIINNPIVTFNKSSNETKTVSYKLSNTGVGEWSGNLNVKISLDQKAESNVLINGTSFNNILQDINPTTITFSKDVISGDYLYDLSLAQDESILLYQNGTEVIISNGSSENIIANEDMSFAFYYLKNLEKINHLDYLDTSRVTNMSQMFDTSEKLKTLDVSSFNTSNVTNMSKMFHALHGCTSIVGIENFDVANVETFNRFLFDSRKLNSVPDLTNLNISSKCKDISYMLASIAYTQGVNGASKWPTTEVNYSKWDVSGVTNMENTFGNAFMLTTLNLTGWNTSNVTNMRNMFRMADTNDNSRLKQIKGIENFDVSNVTNMEGMFYDCRSLDTSNVFTSWDISNVETIENMFYENRRLDLKQFEDWGQIISEKGIAYTNCFGGRAGYYTDRNYKPSWYK